MTDRPIPFLAPMVRALLSEAKTQTRRLAKVVGPTGERLPVDCPEESLIELEDGEFRRGKFHYLSTGALSGPYDLRAKVGDRLWVRESLECANGEAVGYPADGTWLPNTPWRWRRAKLPSIHMPREMSRITLTVTDVRVQRLQDISEEDAQAEGLHWELVEGARDQTDAVDAYADLWDSIHGSGAWAKNPWVCALTFSVSLRNIDASLAAT